MLLVHPLHPLPLRPRSLRPPPHPHAAYVIMIAGANEIAASAVGLVYFAAIGPTILVKLTAPYW